MNKLHRTILGDTNNPQHRTALANNGKVFAANAYNLVDSWAEMERTQAWTMLFSLKTVSGTQDRIFDTRYNVPVTDRGMAIVANNSYVLGLLRNNQSGSNQIVFQSAGLKIGLNNFIVTYNGSSLNSGFQVFVNGRKETLSTSGVLSGTIVNGSQKIMLATAADVTGLPPLQQWTGNLRKTQIINRVATTEEIREGFNLGTFEGVIPDANFLLDVDFNKTGTAAPTTRPSTPTYTISNFGTTSYASYY